MPNAANDPERPEEARPQEASQEPQTKAEQDEQAAGQAPEGEQLDATPWEEPLVPSRAIFTAIYKAGGKNADDLQRLLMSNQTTLGWADFWANEGYLTRTQGNGGQRFSLSHRAVLELELE